jgi:hypothetical protein
VLGIQDDLAEARAEVERLRAERDGARVVAGQANALLATLCGVHDEDDVAAARAHIAAQPATAPIRTEAEEECPLCGDPLDEDHPNTQCVPCHDMPEESPRVCSCLKSEESDCPSKLAGICKGRPGLSERETLNAELARRGLK